MAYVRNGIYDVDTFLDLVNMSHTKDDIAVIDGDPIKLGSDRYKLFKYKGTTCVKCGIRGTFFAKERTYTKKPTLIVSWHMNLYAIDENGQEVLMTKDHIIAKIRGGKNYHDNYQTMCQPCNSEKGSDL